MTVFNGGYNDPYNVMEGLDCIQGPTRMLSEGSSSCRQEQKLRGTEMSCSVVLNYYASTCPFFATLALWCSTFEDASVSL